MDFNVFSGFYLIPLAICAIGGLIEFRNCNFDQPGHAVRKAFFLAFRSMVPALNILFAILYLVTCASYSLQKSPAWKRSRFNKK